MSLAAPDELQVISNFKYRDKVNPGSLFLAGGVSKNFPVLKDHEQKPFAS